MFLVITVTISLGIVWKGKFGFLSDLLANSIKISGVAFEHFNDFDMIVTRVNEANGSENPKSFEDYDDFDISMGVKEETGSEKLKPFGGLTFEPEKAAKNGLCDFDQSEKVHFYDLLSEAQVNQRTANCSNYLQLLQEVIYSKGSNIVK